MRYIALALVLIVLSRTMPMMVLDGSNADIADNRVEALSAVDDLPVVVAGNELAPTFADFEAPQRSPVKSVLEAARRRVTPDSPPSRLSELKRFEYPVTTASFAQETDVGPVQNTPVLIVDAPTTKVPTPQSADMRTVNASALNVRVGPSGQHQVVGALTRGDEVVIVGSMQKGWVPVRGISSEIEGWVFSRYLAPSA